MDRIKFAPLHVTDLKKKSSRYSVPRFATVLEYINVITEVIAFMISFAFIIILFEFSAFGGLS